MKPLPQKYAMGSDWLAGQVCCDLLDSHLVRVYTPRPPRSAACALVVLLYWVLGVKRALARFKMPSVSTPWNMLQYDDSCFSMLIHTARFSPNYVKIAGKRPKSEANRAWENLSLTWSYITSCMSSHVLHCETQFVDKAEMSGILPIEKLSTVWFPENRAVCHAWVNQKKRQKKRNCLWNIFRSQSEQ